MSQLETNTTTIQSLIEKANSLPDAGSGGSGGNETCTVTINSTSFDNYDFILYTSFEDGEIKSNYSALTSNTILENVLVDSCVTARLASTAPRCIGDVTLINYLQVGSNNPFAGAYQINGDCIFTYTPCLIYNTLVTLSNRTTKPVQDITYDDELLVWDFDNGCYSSAMPIWIKKPDITPYYYRCEFADGTILKLVGSDGNCHRVFNVDTNSFEYANNSIGNKVMTQNGITTLLSCERINEEVEFYNIITNHHLNLFAENVLTSCRLNNLYPIKDMKFIKDERKLIPIEEFVDITEDMYHGLRLGEQNIDIDELNKYIANLNMRKL